jgi:1-deoxy-D-xylulose-5-phosphate synthase
MIQDALDLSDRLRVEDGLSVGVVNARFIKPLDSELLLSQAKSNRLVVTLEDGVLSGGFGSAVLETISDAGLSTAVHRIGWPDRFVEHGTNVNILRASAGLAPDQMLEGIRGKFKALLAEIKETV